MIDDKGNKYIYLRSLFTKRFNRQTAYHELRHHFSGHLGAKNKKSLAIKEKEANYFAFLATGIKGK